MITLLVLTTFSLIVILSYTIYTLKVIGITKLTSISNGFYELEKIKKGRGVLFQLAMAFTVIPIIPVLLQVTDDNFKIIAFIAAAPILFVAIAPRFDIKDTKGGELEHKVHVYSALISAAASLTLLLLQLGSIGFAIILSVAMIFYLLYRKFGTKRNITTFGEYTCFTITFVCAYLAILLFYQVILI
jgi:hypothetical protein